MYADKVTRLLSYHDTWLSMDPIQGCAYQCAYCVLRHAGNTGVRPQVLVSPNECVARLLKHPLFVRDYTPLAIGNETDMLHPSNQDYLVELLSSLQAARLRNSVSLITKAPLTDKILGRIQAVKDLNIVFFLSYSGLGPKFEPNFTDDKLRANFFLVKSHGFKLVHFWRPLMPENSRIEQIRNILSFVAPVADASVIVGLKLHPELSRVLVGTGIVSIPSQLLNAHGEWLEEDTIEQIFAEASRLCPKYPLYRHTSCALACVTGHANHTATVFRTDICSPSHCPVLQRAVCVTAKKIPDEQAVDVAISRLARPIKYRRLTDRVIVEATVTQEEYAYLLHQLNCPIQVKAIQYQNLYRGNIFANEPDVTDSNKLQLYDTSASDDTA